MDKPVIRERLERVLGAIFRIEEFVAGVGEETFLKDIKLQSAVLYQFLVIGEAIRSVDKNVLQKYPYPWHIPCAFRNFIIHEYFGIKMIRIYYATLDLDDLKRQVNAILTDEF